ncbi:ABC transporter permease [Aneurinibacillus terranovensis]|uniref:ABC transporter permease n=1 Tax=Aneurinibacillus terranovensis TaxID=278991 RepID=UPI00042386E2|nr:ABC transporter permease subunit [Aneurinibacillus terranovensis]
MKMPLFSSMNTKRFGWADVLVLFVVFGLLYAMIRLGAGMEVPFTPTQKLTISLNPWYLPYYAGRSLLRMFLAFGASLVFTLIYGRIAANSRTAEKIMIPLIDILQSVPVLGFLSATVTGFISLFPGSLFGVECASIFAIFTGQAWNMTFSFYYSLRTVPKDLHEFSMMGQLSGWTRFTKLEVPYAMIGLIWNSMMSFGGGWFFLAASETITVLNNHIQLPGIGSYIATAIDEGNMRAVVYASVVMVLMIILVDQLFWRPIVAWAQKFKNEQTQSGDAPTSWVLLLIQRAHMVESIVDRIKLTSKRVKNQLQNRFLIRNKESKIQSRSRVDLLAKWIAAVIVTGYVLYLTYQGAILVSQLSFREIVHVVWLGLLTSLRVFVSTFIGAIWTIPVGVTIGFNPRLARIAQPIVQILASFPANMVFPFLTLVYLKLGVNFEWGAIPLMMLGTQWYILFNVIAGAMAIPSDLREAAAIHNLSTLKKWKVLILPGIFPFFVTGGITASGGAWNASIVSEIVSWKGKGLVATGLGSYISQATTSGNWAQIIWGIFVMSVLVVLFNRLVWRRLYTLAENKFDIE